MKKRISLIKALNTSVIKIKNDNHPPSAVIGLYELGGILKT